MALYNRELIPLLEIVYDMHGLKLSDLPESLMLNGHDVRSIAEGTKEMWVVQPQDYRENSILLLTKDHEAFEDRDQEELEDRIGYFSLGYADSDPVGTGGGNDFWLKANNELVKELEKRIKSTELSANGKDSASPANQEAPET